MNARDSRNKHAVVKGWAFTILMLVASPAVGQGWVTFNNKVTSRGLDAPIYGDFLGGTRIDGSDPLFRAALLGGSTNSIPAFIFGSRTNGPSSGEPVQGSLRLLADPSTGVTWAGFRTGTNAGYVNVGTEFVRDSGVGWSTLGLFQVVAWRGPYETWDSAYAAWQSGTDPSVLIGASNPLLLETAADPLNPSYPYLVGLKSFTLVAPVPEPGLFPLLSLGALVCAGFARRRNKRSS